MNKNMPVIIELCDLEGIVTFEGSLKEMPKIETNINEIAYMTTSNWVASSYKWNHIELGFITECDKKQNWISDWVRKTSHSIVGTEGYASDYKKTINLISLDSSNPYKWTLVGAMMVSFEMCFYPEQKLKNFIKNSKIFTRKVLFEKINNPTKEIGFNMTLNVDRAILHG